MTRLWKLQGTLVILTIVLTIACAFKNEDYATNQINKELSSADDTTAYRLPENVIPDTYYIRLIPFIENNNFTYDGLVHIIANVTKETTIIVLHTKNLEIHNVTVLSFDKKTGFSKHDVKNITRQEKYQFLNIEMYEPIEAHTNITITISYTGDIDEYNSEGLFRRSYTVNNETRWVLATQMQATSARSVFPCFDEPALRAVFQMSVVVPHNYTAISNMPVRSITKGNTYEFEKTPPMSTYLVALVVSDFSNLTMTDGNRTYRVWAQPELAHQLPYSLSIIPKALNFFETRLGVPYPLSKVDMVAIPYFYAGAMENWGLQIYSEFNMLNNLAVTNLLMKRSIRNTVTHEHAHQWFGNLVTPKWWDYTWLSEAFARYFQYHAHENEISSWDLESQFVVDQLHVAFDGDADESSRPITDTVYSPSQIQAMFDIEVILYKKSSSIVRMIEKVLGPKIFYGALRRYLLKNKYSTGTPELLIEAFEQEINSNNYKLHASMSEVVDTWTVQSGFPVVSVQFTGDTVAIKQKRFFLHPPRNFTFNTTWCIPINWATQSKPDFSNTEKLVWVRDSFTSIPIENASKDWVIFNIQRTGFYRVNYDNQMWQRIIDTLKSNKFEVIHEINRASLIDDLFNLGRVGEVDYRIVFSATQYLKKETNYIPWTPAFSGFSYLKTRLAGYPEIYRHLKAYITALLEPIYRKLGFDERNNESNFDTLLRNDALEWLCSLGHQGCINEARNAFNNLQQNRISALSPNQQEFIYCTVIKFGTMKEYNYLWQKLEKSTNPLERSRILTGITCTRNSSNIETLINDSFGSNNKIADLTPPLFLIPKNNDVGLPIILSYLERHFDNVTEAFIEFGVEQFVKDVYKQLSTEDQLNQLNAIVKNNHQKLSNISLSLQTSLESTTYELSQLKNYSPTILKWLRNNK